MKWEDAWAQACLCMACEEIVTGEECIWRCSCGDIQTIYGCLTEEEKPGRWLKGTLAFAPWKEENH